MFEDKYTDIMDKKSEIFLLREIITKQPLIAILDIKFLIPLKS